MLSSASPVTAGFRGPKVGVKPANKRGRGKALPPRKCSFVSGLAYSPQLFGWGKQPTEDRTRNVLRGKSLRHLEEECLLRQRLARVVGFSIVFVTTVASKKLEALW